nr:MAG: hypothetical protein BECKH772A_GA0070896_1000720 [Candidatus Kentron sp. H]
MDFAILMNADYPVRRVIEQVSSRGFASARGRRFDPSHARRSYRSG